MEKILEGLLCLLARGCASDRLGRERECGDEANKGQEQSDTYEEIWQRPIDAPILANSMRIEE